MLRMVVNGKRPMILKQQYRMHPVISAFASKQFYRSLLRDGISKDDRRWEQPVIDWPNPEAPIVFWNVDTLEEYSGSGTSLVNRGEATAISQLVRKFASSRIDGWSLGIITPYIGQVMYLYDSLPTLSGCDDDFLGDVEIDTVDAFQGREKDFIIFSCVRSNDECTIGFLRDKRRMNVALTRARYGLIVIGNAGVFKKNPIWGNFIEHCRGLNAFVRGDLGSWEEAEFAGNPEPLELSEFDHDSQDDLV
jgi:regulator of nonsense transcripts 1